MSRSASSTRPARTPLVRRAGHSTRSAGTRLVRDWPAVAALVFDIYAEVVGTGQPYRGTREFATPAGLRLIDISVNAFPGGLVHIGRDVTDERGRSRPSARATSDSGARSRA